MYSICHLSSTDHTVQVRQLSVEEGRGPYVKDLKMLKIWQGVQRQFHERYSGGFVRRLSRKAGVEPLTCTLAKCVAVFSPCMLAGI